MEGEWTEIGYMTRDFNVLVQDTIHHTHGSQYITGTHDEMDRQEVILYPNPTDGQFQLKINDLWRNSQLTVLDITGKIVYQAAVTQDEVILELPHLSSGLYVLTLQKGFKQRSFTIVKQ